MNQNLDNIDNILKYDKLQNVIHIIEKLMEDKKYVEAYYKVAVMLEFINANLLMRYFKVKLQDTDIIDIIELYRDKDKKLYSQMISINAEYNNIDISRVKENDIIYLLLRLDDILGYILNKYGEII